jgi:hypothetical protein
MKPQQMKENNTTPNPRHVEILADVMNRNTEEIWKDIQGTKEIYQISTFGNFRRYYRTYKEWRYLNGGICSRGYRYFKARTLDDKPKNFMIHRLIAIAFIPNPENKTYINHIDGDRLNNNIKNIEWATNRENSCHSRMMKFPNKLIGTTYNKSKEKYVSKIRIELKQVDLGLFDTELDAHEAYKDAHKFYGIKNKYLTL